MRVVWVVLVSADAGAGSTGGSLTDDPQALGALIEESEGGDLAGATGGGRLMPTGGMWDRLMNTSPDPDLDDVEPYDVSGWEAGLKYLRRGLGKFTGAGSTALEDGIMAGVNLFAGLWAHFSGPPQGQEEGVVVVEDRDGGHDGETESFSP